jgi:hypothetical protein
VGIRDVGDHAFSDSFVLTSVDLPVATIIGDRSFHFCFALTSVNIPAATTIGTSAFSITALTTVNIPMVETIGNSAFQNCAALTSISLPASLSSISSTAFSGCAALTSITIDSDNPDYKDSDDKMILNKVGTTLIAYPSASGAVTALPVEITNIGSNAFAFNAALTSVSLPHIISIGSGAFSNCAALTSVDFPAATTIGGAFSSCTALTLVNLPAATSIEGTAFMATGIAPLTITLGNTAPASLGTLMFSNIASSKTVTVKVPSGATAWSGIISGSPYTDPDITDNWGNGFRGGGWNGSTMTDSTRVNQYITLNIETYTP